MISIHVTPLEEQNQCTMQPQPLQDFKFIEHYAGHGELTNTVREEHGVAARLDLNYHRGHDILTPAGFALGPHFFICNGFGNKC